MTLHPGAVEPYRRTIAELHDHLRKSSPATEVRPAFRNPVDSVAVKERPKRAPYQVEIYGRLGALLGLNLFPEQRHPKEIVTTYNGDAEKAVSSSSTRTETQYVPSRSSPESKAPHPLSPGGRKWPCAAETGEGGSAIASERRAPPPLPAR